MKAKHAKGKSGGAKALTAVLSVLAVILAAACVLSFLILNDPEAKKAQIAQPSDAVAKAVLKSAVTGEECTFTPDEMSGYLQYLAEKEDAKLGDAEIEAAVLTAAPDNTASLYLPVLFHGKSLGVTMNVELSCDTEINRMAFKIRSLKLGRRPVSPGWALGFVKDSLPGGLSVDGDTVYRDASLLSLSVGDSFADLKITKLEMKDGLVGLQVQGKADLSFLGDFT